MGLLLIVILPVMASAIFPCTWLVCLFLGRHYDVVIHKLEQRIERDQLTDYENMLDDLAERRAKIARIRQKVRYPTVGFIAVTLVLIGFLVVVYRRGV